MNGQKEQVLIRLWRVCFIYGIMVQGRVGFKEKGELFMKRAENFLNMTLFAMPSFLNGFSRVLDLGGTFDVYNENETGEKADCQALSSDWRQVGEDIYFAMERHQHG